MRIFIIMDRGSRLCTIVVVVVVVVGPFQKRGAAISANRGNVARYRRSVEGARRVPHSSEDRSPAIAAILPAN